MSEHQAGASPRRRHETVLNRAVSESSSGIAGVQGKQSDAGSAFVPGGIPDRSTGIPEGPVRRRSSRGTVLNPAVTGGARGEAPQPPAGAGRGTVLNPAVTGGARGEAPRPPVGTGRGTVLNPAVTGGARGEAPQPPTGTGRGTVLNPAVTGGTRGEAPQPPAGAGRGTVLNPVVTGGARGEAPQPPVGTGRGTVLNPAVTGGARGEASRTDAGTGRGTVLNPSVADQGTARGRRRGTVLNPAVADQGAAGSRGTVVNPNIPDNRARSGIPPEYAASRIQQGIPTGTVLLGRYVVRSQMNVESGEADLYIVTQDQTEFVAKVYRRKSSIKPEVVDKLLAIQSPYIARIFDIGEYGEHTVEIIPFYRNGTLQGKQFTFRDLKEWIIPSLNQGLHDLHEIGIIHKDLKPSNIMLNNDGRSVSIIDFGISSVKQDGAAYLVTQTGRTPIYSAPETAGDLFLSESDYYSLGITVFELFAGSLPYDGLTDEQRMRIISLQKIPCPPEMPDELKQLIWGLTYSDLTNRNDKKNPNRRWTYEEVLRWCRGEKQVTPGDSFSAGAQAHPYWFRGKSYTDLINLLLDFNRYWEEGKKQLYRGNLGMYFLESNIDQTKATYCEEAVEELNSGGNEDLIFFKTLYYICPEMRNLLWKGAAFADLVDFGKELLKKMRAKDFSMDPLLKDMTDNGILSCYQRIQDQRTGILENRGTNIESAQCKALEAMEAARRANYGDLRSVRVLDFQMAFMLSGSRTLVAGGNSFKNLNELAGYVQKVVEDGNVFERLYNELMVENGDLTPQFESWLLTQDKRAELEQWRKSVMG